MSHLRKPSKRARRRRAGRYYVGRPTRRERVALRIREKDLLRELDAWWESLPADEQLARMRALLYDEPLDVKYRSPEELARLNATQPKEPA